MASDLRFSRTQFDPQQDTLIITGASGFLGRYLVPLCVTAGYRLLLCGRNPEALSRQYPGLQACQLEALPDRLQSGTHAMLHLAVLNSDANASEEAYIAANVTYLKTALEYARAAGVVHVIYPSSFHIQTQTTPYAKSKAVAEATIKACTDMKTKILYLPAVYGATFQGRLGVLNKVPRSLRGTVFHVLHSLRSTVHVDHVFDAVHTTLKTGCTGDKIITDDQNKNPVYCFCKRMIDLAFTAAIIALLWWLLVLIWVLVKVTSPGPGFFIQDRLGRNGVVFRCHKFRTMAVGTKQVGTHEAPSHAITKVGAVLRKFKLDELPQIWNLLKGEMSLVGPRPCLPVQEALIDARKELKIFDLRPGISGLAQVNGVDMSTPEHLARVDEVYAKKRTLVMDIKIVLATLPGFPLPQELKI